MYKTFSPGDITIVKLWNLVHAGPCQCEGKIAGVECTEPGDDDAIINQPGDALAGSAGARPADAGAPAVDAGAPPADAGAPPADAGAPPPADAGAPPPADAGAPPPADAGAPPADAGAPPPADAGAPPPADAGAPPPADAGAPPPADAGAPPPADAGAPPPADAGAPPADAGAPPPPSADAGAPSPPSADAGPPPPPPADAGAPPPPSADAGPPPPPPADAGAPPPPSATKDVQLPQGPGIEVTPKHVEDIFSASVMTRIKEALDKKLAPPTLEFDANVKFPRLNIDLYDKNSWRLNALTPSVFASSIGDADKFKVQAAVDLFNVLFDRHGLPAIRSGVQAFLEEQQKDPKNPQAGVKGSIEVTVHKNIDVGIHATAESGVVKKFSANVTGDVGVTFRFDIIP